MLLISLLLSHLIELVENAHKKFLHRHRCGIFAPILLLFFVHFVFVFFLLCSVFFRWRPYNRIHRSVWLKWRMNESEDEKETKYKIKQCTEDLLTNDSTKTEWENWWTGIFVRIFLLLLSLLLLIEPVVLNLDAGAFRCVCFFVVFYFEFLALNSPKNQLVYIFNANCCDCTLKRKIKPNLICLVFFRSLFLSVLWSLSLVDAVWN